MRKKWLLHLIAVVSMVVFIILGVASATGPSRSEIIKAESIDEIERLSDKFTWLFANAETGGNYVLNVDADTRLAGSLTSGGTNFLYDFSFKDKNDITITLKGIGKAQNIVNIQYSGMFNIGSGVTLILENVLLNGCPQGAPRQNLNSVIVVGTGGTFIMNEGSGVVGNMSFRDGGGVRVSNGGTFLMNDGIIKGNTCFQPEDAALAAASGGSANTFNERPCRGGGVFVAVGGTFTKTGGTIAGFSSNSKEGNITRSFNGIGVSNNNGHAVFAALGSRSGSGLFATVSETGSKRKETNAGPDVNLHIGSDGTFSGGWDF